MELNFTSPMPMSVNDYLGKKVAFVGGKTYVQVYETPKSKQYKKYMSLLLKRVMKDSNWITPSKNEYVVVECVFYMDKRRKDADNHYKLLLDTLVENNIVLDDDAILPVTKDILIDTKNPRVEVRIYLSKKVGVFKDEYDYDTFISNNCSNCKRFNRNCSILKKAMENRIQEEIDRDKLICTKKNAIQ